MSETKAKKEFKAGPAADFRPMVLVRELGNLITMNLLFLVTCIPIVTIPAAVTSLSRLTCLIVQDKNYFLWQDYWATFKREFGKALLGGVVFTVAIALFVYAALVYYSLFGSSTLFILILALIACVVLVLFLASAYYWTMLAYIDLPFKALFKNSLIMVFGCWKRSILALIFSAVHLFILFGLAPVGVGAFSLATDIWLFSVALILFSVHSLLMNYAVWPAIYEKVVKPEARARRSMATVLGTKEKIAWEEEELQSASTDSLSWEEPENGDASGNVK